MLVRRKICIKKRDGGEVKQRGGRRSEKEYTAQPQYIGLSLFPDVFKDSGFFINKGVFHSLSHYLINCH